MDEFVRKYVLKVRKRGGAVNTTLVVAGAKGIVESLDRTRLVEYGGDITFTTSGRNFFLTLQVQHGRRQLFTGVPETGA